MSTPDTQAPGASTTPHPTDVSVPSPGVTLSPRALLVRASLDTRGVRPRAVELARVDADPAALEDLLAEFVKAPGFGVRVRDLFARSYRTRFEGYVLPEGFNPFEALDEAEFSTEEEAIAALARAERYNIEFQLGTGEEPLRLLEALAVEDRPYSELLTADFTFVNEVTAEVWPVEGYDADRGGWQRVTYSDGRPVAGLLSQNALNFRHVTDEANLNRARANHLSRILVCDDYLKRPIDFPRNIDLTDEDGIANAIDRNSACVGCHASLDSLGSYLYGFVNGENGDPSPIYDLEREGDWEEFTGRAPAYHGQPGDGLPDLARQIQADPRFTRCAVQRVYEGLMERRSGPADDAALERHHRAFAAGGFRLSALFLSVLSDPAYRGDSNDRRVSLEAKLMSPEVLQLAVEDLTGYAMRRGHVDLLRSDSEGLHVLAGGLDARSGDQPSTTSNVSRVLVQSRLAEGAGLWALQQSAPLVEPLDIGDDFDRRGFSSVFERVLSRAPSKAELDALESLHQDVRAAGLDAEETYAALVSTLLRDPEFLVY